MKRLTLVIDVDQAVAVLQASIAAHSMGLVAHINGQANAAKKGIRVAADQILEVFRPDFAERVWQAEKRAGIDIPLRIHIYEYAGQTLLGFRTPLEIFAPYQNPALLTIADELETVFDSMLGTLEPYVYCPGSGMTATAQSALAPTRTWMCTICDYVYDEAVGDPEHGIQPGTRFEDISDDWVCPDCGVGKSDFVMFDD